MTNYNVRITEDDGSVNIYTEAKIGIADNEITVDYEDQRAVHHMDQTEEIVIRPNR